MKKIIGLIALVSFITINSYGQKGWKWPVDSLTKIKAEEMNVIQSDAIKMKNYRVAANALGWLFVNTPELNKSIYINGAKAYDNLAKNEKNSVLKAKLVDSLLMVYDERVKYFGDKPNVLNRKVFKAYKYSINDPSKYEWLLEIFDEAFDIGGSKIPNNNLVAYMNVIKVNAKAKKINEDEVLIRYDKLSAVIDQKIRYNKEKGKSNEKLLKNKEMIDTILTDIIHIDCEFIESKMAPKFYKDPSDIKLVKRLFTFMLSGKCTASPLFLNVAIQLQKVEPDFGLAKVIATKYLVNKNYSSAIKYYNQALKLTDKKLAKTDIYISQGKVYKLQNNKTKARIMFKEALTASPGNKNAYNEIGDLYYHSYKDCKEKIDMVKDRLVFIIAYDMYKKAGNTKKMNSSKEQFPSKEELFNGDYQVGEKLLIGCWINKSVTLKTRD